MKNKLLNILLGAMVVITVIFTISIVVFIGSFVNNQFYQPKILGDLKLRYISKNNYHLIYQNKKIAGNVTGLDSWYIKRSSVYGTTTSDPKDDYADNDLIYFYVDVCNDEIFTTKNSEKFDIFLWDKDIASENWMSGDNVLDVKKGTYNSTINCDDFKSKTIQQRKTINDEIKQSTH